MKEILKKNLEEIEYNARKRNIPVILGDSKQVLIDTILSSNPLRILEIGTAIGYSGSVMLAYSSDKCVLDTIEIDDDRYNEAVGNFNKFNYTNRVNAYCGDATDILPVICDRNKYDFVFIDGPKSKYGYYFDIIEKSLKKNAVVFCDNVLFRGMVEGSELPPRKYRTIVLNLRKFMAHICDNDKYDTTIMTCGDGIAIIKVK